MTPYQRSANQAGWFEWFGVWLHTSPWESGFERPHYWRGTARDLCLSQGLETGESI